MIQNSCSYRYDNTNCGLAHSYLLPAIENIITSLNIHPKQAFDLGCGNGSIANWLSNKGFTVSGVDPSEMGIRQSNKSFPNLDLRIGSAYDPLQETFGKFPLVLSLEVIEHVYYPRAYANTVKNLLTDDGFAIISTPYHGYWKNLSLALTNKMDSHFTALWDHGHIKFWSIQTISILFEEVGLKVVDIKRVGRVIPALAKSMIIVLRKK